MSVAVERFLLVNVKALSLRALRRERQRREGVTFRVLKSRQPLREWNVRFEPYTPMPVYYQYGPQRPSPTVYPP
jgi:hypothetical protein